MIAAFLFVCLLYLLSCPIVNDYQAEQVRKGLCSLPLPEKTELVDSVSQAGKLVGCGNGMQFFGAILIKSELSVDELNTYYSDFREQECMVQVQKTQEIDFIEHVTLQFSAKMETEEEYYIVYSWGDGISPFRELDLRGH